MVPIKSCIILTNPYISPINPYIVFPNKPYNSPETEDLEAAGKHGNSRQDNSDIVARFLLPVTIWIMPVSCNLSTEP